jgi:hypothetical protein
MPGKCGPFCQRASFNMTHFYPPKAILVLELFYAVDITLIKSQPSPERNDPRWQKLHDLNQNGVFWGLYPMGTLRLYLLKRTSVRPPTWIDIDSKSIAACPDEVIKISNTQPKHPQ